MTIHSTAFIHPAAFVCGDVTLGARASVWPGAVIRADSAPISIGESSNVQDGVVIHVDPGLPCTIGARVAKKVEADRLLTMVGIVLIATSLFGLYRALAG